MRKIKLEKIDIKELEAMSEEISLFIVNQSAGLLATKNTDQYFGKLMMMDTAQAAFQKFWKTIMNASRHFATMTISVSEAIVLIQCCIDAIPKGEFHRYVIEKFKGLLHQQIVNLV